MKKIFYLILLLAFAFQASAQIVNNGPGTFVWVDTPPTHNPNTSGAKFAVNRNTFIWYEHIGGTTWAASGDRIQQISGCSAPNYTPANHQSRIVINGCSPTPELYFYVSGTTWAKLPGGGSYTAGEGIVIDGDTIRLDTLERLSFNTAPMLSGGIGTLRWNDTDGTLDLGLKGGNVTLQLGQEQTTLVKHADNIGLANGAVVYTAGGDGTNKTVRLARANSDATSANTFGVMTESATGGNKGFCTTFGLVRDINTAALTEGAIVWLSASVAGAMTSTRPTAPNHGVHVGFCIRSHATQGVIFVSVQNGYELGELHDVSVASATNGQSLNYNSGAGVWQNQTVADQSATNEIQTLSISGQDLTLSSGGGTVTIPSVTFPLLAPADGVPNYSFDGYPTSGISNEGGSISIKNNSESGDLRFFSGDGVGDAGEYVMNAGNSSAATGGLFGATAGDGVSGGGFNMRAGNGTTGAGGGFIAQAGDGASGGPFVLRGGNSTADESLGGSFSIAAGNAAGSEASGGQVNISAGNATGPISSGGSVQIQSGEGTTGSGSVDIKCPPSALGGGQITIGQNASVIEIRNATSGNSFLRILNPYTPTSTLDVKGSAGAISWDTNFIYVKTAAGWKRSALSTF